MTIINSIYKGKRYAILLTTILTFYAPVLFAQHIADSALCRSRLWATTGMEANKCHFFHTWGRFDENYFRQAWEIVCKDSFPD